MSRRILFCFTCNAKYDVSQVNPGSRFLCKNCKTTIKVPSYFPENNGTDILEPKDAPDDDIDVISDELIMDSGDELKGLSFTKMVATGNDFVVVDATAEPLAEPGEAAKILCDRRFGVGSDGLLLVMPSESADIRMRFYNPDGSEAEMCGNGLRCLARFAYTHGHVKQRIMDVETAAGLKLAEIHLDGDKVASVKIGLGAPELEPAKVPIKVDGDKALKVPIEIEGAPFTGTAVSMGNPHFVIHVDDVDAVDLAEIGPKIEHHDMFPNRTNVEFVQVVSPSVVLQRTWERGAGETLACGTGAGAVCVASSLLELTEPRLTIRLRGGDLQVERAESGEIFLQGPAEELFTGLWCAE